MTTFSSSPFVISDFFTPLLTKADHDFVDFAETIERDAKIEDHPFFILAKQQRSALTLWASQELIVTNPFSQVLFHVIGNIKNVHARSLLLPVVSGEHSKLKKGIADKAHPWLIRRLCRSMNINDNDVQPTQAVLNFIEVLESVSHTPMRALGVLGVGNELMLISEYRAIEACFDSAYPEADYKDFLHANIGEDEYHTKLIGVTAAAMTALGYSSDEFIAGARDGVNARVAYYDELLDQISSTP